MANFSEKRQSLIQQKVLDIMINNCLTRDEVQMLFQNGLAKPENERVLCVAEQIYSLFLEEDLSISEGVSVMTAVKPVALELK